MPKVTQLVVELGLETRQSDSRPGGFTNYPVKSLVFFFSLFLTYTLSLLVAGVQKYHCFLVIIFVSSNIAKCFKINYN